MMKKMFTRKSDEGVPETHLGTTRYAPKITIEEYTSAKISVDSPLHLNLSLPNESTNVTNENLDKHKLAKSQTSSDSSYATNIYCQVIVIILAHARGGPCSLAATPPGCLTLYPFQLLFLKFALAPICTLSNFCFEQFAQKCLFLGEK
jgi:hypothetical protein